MAQTVFYFARLNVLGRPHAHDLPEKLQMMRRGLLSTRPIEARHFYWRFFEVSELSDPILGEVFHGYLGKYPPTADLELATFGDQSIAHEEKDNFIVAKSRFFLQASTGVIAFRPRSRHISRKVFMDRFAAVYAAGLDDFFVEPEVLPIQEQFRVLEEMQRFEVITKVVITLHPANPRTTKAWERAHRRLDRLNVDTYSERY